MFCFYLLKGNLKLEVLPDFPSQINANNGLLMF